MYVCSMQFSRFGFNGVWSCIIHSWFNLRVVLLLVWAQLSYITLYGSVDPLVCDRHNIYFQNWIVQTGHLHPGLSRWDDTSQCLKMQNVKRVCLQMKRKVEDVTGRCCSALFAHSTGLLSQVFPPDIMYSGDTAVVPRSDWPFCQEGGELAWTRWQKYSDDTTNSMCR